MQRRKAIYELVGVVLSSNTYQHTFRITMTLVHKVLDCVQVAIGTGQREWGVISIVDCTCMQHVYL